MATKGAKRVRGNVGAAAEVRGANGREPQGAGASIPDFEGDGTGRPRSLEILKERMPTLTAVDVVEFMGYGIIDVFEDNLPVEKMKVANASVGRMLKAVEMQERFGQQVKRGSAKRLSLLPNPVAS